MEKVKEVYFKVQAEFICELVRQQYWLEKKPLNQAIKSLTDSFNGLTEDIARDILTGKKLLAGLYPDEEIKLIEDNKQDDYKEHLEYIKKEERIVEQTNLSPYEEYLIAFKNQLPSHYCRSDNHTMDNSTVDWRPEKHCLELIKNDYKLIGVCLNPEYAKEDRIGYLIEDQRDFHQFWYHGQDRAGYRLTLEMLEESNK